MPDNATIAQSLFDAWEKRTSIPSERNWPVTSLSTMRLAARRQRASRCEGLVRVVGHGLPDTVAGMTVVAESGDTVAIQGLFEGTNTGDFGSLPATGRSVSLPWVNVLRFDSDGRIIAGSAYYDQLTIMIQLGHIDAPTATSAPRRIGP